MAFRSYKRRGKDINNLNKIKNNKSENNAKTKLNF